jgi:hypothetical protein
MDRAVGLAILLLLAVCLSPSGVAGLGAGEVSILGAAASGDYGTDFDGDSQWLTLRYVTGNDFQFRAELSMVRVGVLSGVSFTSLGPTSTGGNGWQGRHDREGAGSAGGMNSSFDESTTETIVFEENQTAGLGDLRLAASKRLFGGGVKLFRFDANLEVKVPTANENENLGTGEWDYRLGIASEYRLWSATAYGGFGWNKLGDPAWVDFNDVVDVYVGIDSNPIARERLILGGWVEGWQEAIDSVGRRAALGVGVRTTGKTRWRLQVRTGLTDAAADVAVLVGVSFGISPPGPGIRGPQR